MATGWGRRMRVKAQTLVTYGTAAYSGAPAIEALFCAGLCTVATSAPFVDDGSSVTVAGTEPSSTGGYARQTFTFTTPATPANDAAAITGNVAGINFTSSAAFSTGATVLNTVIVMNSTTLANVAEANFCGRAPLSNPVAVSAGGITIAIAAYTAPGTGLAFGIISA